MNRNFHSIGETFRHWHSGRPQMTNDMYNYTFYLIFKKVNDLLSPDFDYAMEIAIADLREEIADSVEHIDPAYDRANVFLLSTGVKIIDGLAIANLVQVTMKVDKQEGIHVSAKRPTKQPSLTHGIYLRPNTNHHGSRHYDYDAAAKIIFNVCKSE